MILLAALWIEGWRIDALPGLGEGGGAEYFAAWSQQIGELASVPPWSPTLFAWTGLGLLAAPVLLWSAPSGRASAPDCRVHAWRQEKTEQIQAAVDSPERPTSGGRGHLARAQLFLLVIVWALTCWQVRWGYFLPLVYALGVPWQFGAVPARWRAWLAAALMLLLWPMAANGGRPASARRPRRQPRRTTHRRRPAPRHRRDSSPPPPACPPPTPTPPPTARPRDPRPVVAVARAGVRSGQPALAGSSHESLPGTVDVDKFYLAADAREAAAILRRRRVRWVVAYEPDRVLRTAAALFGQTQVSKRAMGYILYARPEMAPRFLRLALVNPFFKVYEVRSASLPTDP